jgi:hypothetical protein
MGLKMSGANKKWRLELTKEPLQEWKKVKMGIRIQMRTRN